MKLRIDLSGTGIKDCQITELKEQVKEIIGRLRSGEQDFTGWVNLPCEYLNSNGDELAEIKRVADEISGKSTMLVVIGIGGSYLGAKSAIDALAKDYKNLKIYFAGNNFSATYHKKLLKLMENEEVSLCVISKSGNTKEIAIAFSIFKEALINKYGRDEAKKRIYAVTDEKSGRLRAEVEKEGYISFVIPGNVGGRYSILTPVGLLPIAAAEIDINEFIKGAAEAAMAPDWEEKLYEYAATRYLLMKKGYSIEVMEYYEPQLEYFAEWVKQLFGESEGKEGQGLFPASLSFSRDLHSMGQFLQEGNMIFFETVLNVVNPNEDIIIPAEAGDILCGKSMNTVNKMAMEGVLAAHKAAGIPNIRIDIPELSPYCLGELYYFFEMTSAITGSLMGVNPFNQPGVESYKKEMQRCLEEL